MKIPKSEFVRFKKKFLQLRDMLNLRCYRIDFKFRPLKDSYAMIFINQNGKVAEVIFASEQPKQDFDVRPSPEQSATHEAVHLFISNLSFLAGERFTSEIEINDEEEKIARVLEKIL